MLGVLWLVASVRSKLGSGFSICQCVCVCVTVCVVRLLQLHKDQQGRSLMVS